MSLDWICYATDKDYLYSVSRSSWEYEDYIVVSRVHLSQALNEQATWDIISVKTTLVISNGLDLTTSKATCTIGISGELFFHTTRGPSPETYYLDINDERLTITNVNTLKPAAMVVYSYLKEQVSRPTTPQIYILPIISTYVEAPPTPTPVTLANTTGAIYDMAYGDKMLFAMIRQPNETSSDTAWLLAKKKLIYIRMDAPYEINDANTSIVSIPWDDECTNEVLSSSGASAAANGKFYYLCARDQRSSEFVRLYIHDTKANTTESYRYPSKVAPRDKKMTLVYNAGSTDGDEPAYILHRDGMYLNLPTSGTAPGSLLSYTSGAQMPTMKDFEELCDFYRIGVKEYVGAVVGGLVFLVFLGFATRSFVRWGRKAILKHADQARLTGDEESLARDAAAGSQVHLNASRSSPSTGP
ncbi:hypothetical protein BGZ94_005242 [Podila epigama]|nr:hypothetical protein BGZ94_005242 [Podila epigama]